MELPRWKMVLFSIAAILLLLLVAYGTGRGHATPAETSRPAVALPTLVPTPAIVVPTPPPGPVTFYGNGNTYNITVNQTTVESCAAVIGCWQR